MGLDMYAFSVAPSEVLPDAAAITRFRFPADGVGLPDGMVTAGKLPIDVFMSSGLPSNAFQQLDDTFLTSKYVLPGSERIHKWRQHPDLHAWMQRLWRVRRRPNPNVSFNSITPVGLELAELDALEHAVRNLQLPHCSRLKVGDGDFLAQREAELALMIQRGSMPPCSGLLFGESDGSEQADDLAFIAEARAAMARGRLVYYTSWW